MISDQGFNEFRPDERLLPALLRRYLITPDQAKAHLYKNILIEEDTLNSKISSSLTGCLLSKR